MCKCFLVIMKCQRIIINKLLNVCDFYNRNASVISGSPFGTGGDVIINSIGCNGTEPDLATCESSPWQKTACSTDEVATVYCHVQRKWIFFLYVIYLSVKQSSIFTEIFYQLIDITD